jgi:serine/threonine protein kinase
MSGGDVPWIRAFTWSHTRERDELARRELDLAVSSVTVIAKIGSESSNGIVFKVAYEGMFFAMKVVPTSKANVEVKIALRLGAEARVDPDLPFLMTYGSGELSAEEAATYGFQCPCVYIIMELAAGDVKQAFYDVRKAFATDGPSGLAQWAHRNQRLLFTDVALLSMAEWKDTMAWQMYCAMKKLHDCRLVHLDIHQGNFLVLNSGKVVISDFGSTEKANTLNEMWAETEHFREAFFNWHQFAGIECARFTDWASSPLASPVIE